MTGFLPLNPNAHCRIGRVRFKDHRITSRVPGKFLSTSLALSRSVKGRGQ